MLIKKIIFALILLGVVSANAQKQKLSIDSLYSELRKSNTDSTKMKVEFNIGNFYQFKNTDSSLVHFQKSLSIAESGKFEYISVLSAKEIAYHYFETGMLDSSMTYFNRAIQNIKKTNSKFIEVFSGLGNLYLYKGDYVKAYEHYLTFLKLAEIDGRPKIISRAYGSVGVALKEQKKLDDALIFFNKSLSIAKANNLQSNLYVAYTNIGNIYSDKNNIAPTLYLIEQALENYLKAKEIVMKLLDSDKDKGNAITLLNNIGSVYGMRKQFDKALQEYDTALELMASLDYFASKSLIYNNLASIHLDMKNTKEAEKYLKLANIAAAENESPSDFMENYEVYSRYYDQKGDYKNAYQFYVRFKKLSDSLFSTETAEKRKELELNAEFDKKETQAKAAQDKREAIEKEEKRRQQIFRNALIVGFILMILVAFLIFRSYRIKKKSNEIITQQKFEVEKQKELVEEKQKEIIDSIRYAKRIQQSLLPTKKYIDKTLKRLNE